MDHTWEHYRQNPQAEATIQMWSIFHIKTLWVKFPPLIFGHFKYIYYIFLLLKLGYMTKHTSNKSYPSASPLS